MKFKVNKDLCIGCGACQAVCPEVFEIEDDGLAAVMVEEIPEEVNEDAIDAKEGCPTNAIEDVVDNLEDAE